MWIANICQKEVVVVWVQKVVMAELVSTSELSMACFHEDGWLSTDLPPYSASARHNGCSPVHCTEKSISGSGDDVMRVNKPSERDYRCSLSSHRQSQRVSVPHLGQP